MANIPGANNILPDAVSSVITESKGASVPGGIRISAIIGEGARAEVIVASAVGAGFDGLNPTYTSANGADGRHFLLQVAPVISNRTQLFRNGIPLIGLEATIDSNSFSDRYDYRIDISTGRIELQTAHLVDQGGSFYSTGSTNIGVGTIQNLTLPDINAPSETWTIKCISVQRNNLNQPIAGTARFVAFGSISGNIADANGDPVVWIADNVVTTNSILSFSILETPSISAFREGDFFTIKVSSGVLTKNDSLSVNYIGVTDLNDPTFFDSMIQLTNKHGLVTLDNTLSLGAQIAFANTPPGVMALQAAPSLPRRNSYVLEANFPSTSVSAQDFILPLPLGVSPDPNSAIHFFVTNPTTGIEKQLLPNKFPFFTLDTVGKPTTNTFIFDDTNPPGGNSYSYSVNQAAATINFAVDGYLARDPLTQINAVFTSSTVGSFDSTYVGKTIKIFDAVNLANNGTFDIVSVSSGALGIRSDSSPPFVAFINESSVSFNLVDAVTGLTVPASSATNGVIAAGSNATATFTSGTINFTTLGALPNGYKLKVTASTNATNIGLYDITANPSSGSVTIAKSFVNEHSLKFEVIDSSITSDYLVVNHNIVPNGNTLRVTLVDVKDSTFFDAGWETALAALETQEIDILVPLPKQTISVIFQNSLSHCQTMSNIRNKKERVLFIGAIDGLTPDNLTGAKPAAVENIGILEGIQGQNIADILSGNTEDLANYSVPNAYGTTFRAVYFFPDEIVVQVGSDNQIISGYYAACAAAGYFSAQANISVPLTNKVLSGFTILKNRQFNQTTYEQLAAAGVTILVPVAGGGRVLWGKTTTQSGFPEEEEISIVFIRDRIAKSLRQGFVAFIGQPEDADIIPSLTARALGMLNSFISQRLITDFADLTVMRDSVDPRQWNISMRVQPVYPVNWIYIKVGVGLL